MAIINTLTWLTWGVIIRDKYVKRSAFPGRFGHVIVIPKDGDKNMVRPEVWRELRLLDALIRNTTAVYEGERFTYSQICARWLDECSSNDILDLDLFIELVYCTYLSTSIILGSSFALLLRHAGPFFNETD